MIYWRHRTAAVGIPVSSSPPTTTGGDEPSIKEVLK